LTERWALSPSRVSSSRSPCSVRLAGRAFIAGKTPLDEMNLNMVQSQIQMYVLELYDYGLSYYVSLHTVENCSLCISTYTNVHVMHTHNISWLHVFFDYCLIIAGTTTKRMNVSSIIKFLNGRCVDGCKWLHYIPHRHGLSLRPRSISTRRPLCSPDFLSEFALIFRPLACENGRSTASPGPGSTTAHCASIVTDVQR
jgi:hypothetical protein